MRLLKKSVMLKSSLLFLEVVKGRGKDKDYLINSL